MRGGGEGTDAMRMRMRMRMLMATKLGTIFCCTRNGASGFSSRDRHRSDCARGCDRAGIRLQGVVREEGREGLCGAAACSPAVAKHGLAAVAYPSVQIDYRALLRLAASCAAKGRWITPLTAQSVSGQPPTTNPTPSPLATIGSTMRAWPGGWSATSGAPCAARILGIRATSKRKRRRKRGRVRRGHSLR